MPQSVAAGASTELPAPPGNRPAQDARQVHAPDAIDGDWHGGDDATDFLGLDLEVGGNPAPASTNGHLEPGTADAGAAPADGVAANSWLLSLDDANAGRTGVAPVAAEAVEEATSEEFAEELPQDLEDPTPEGASPRDTSWTDTEAPRRRRKKRALAMVTLALVAAAGYGAYQYKLKNEAVPDAPLTVKAPANDKTPPSRGRTTDDAAGKTKTPGHASTDTATKPADTHAKPPTNDTATLAAGSTGSAGTDSSTTASSHSATADAADATRAPDASEAAEPRLAAERIESWLRAQHSAEFPESDVGSGWNSRAPFAISNSPNAIAGLSDARWPLPGANDRAPNFGMSRSPSANPGAPTGGVERSPLSMGKSRPADKASRSKGGLRRASVEDLAGVWEGSVIPMDSISAPSRLLTPGVGRVRVVIQRGEIFEGRLYGVGQGLIWLDTEVGRLALLSETVQRIEHLTTPGRGPGLGAPGSQELAGLPRVRVHTPGGTFYGKVIAQDDATVTLITDEGARVMLESRDVESAPAGVRSVIVKPSAAKR